MARPIDASEIAVPFRRPRSAWRDLLGGAVLVSVWLALWTFFTFGVASPAGRLDAPEGRSAAAQART